MSNDWGSPGHEFKFGVTVTVANIAHTMTLPSAVGNGASAKSIVGIQGIASNVITFAETGTYEFQFHTDLDIPSSSWPEFRKYCNILMQLHIGFCPITCCDACLSLRSPPPLQTKARKHKVGNFFRLHHVPTYLFDNKLVWIISSKTTIRKFLLSKSGKLLVLCLPTYLHIT